MLSAMLIAGAAFAQNRRISGTVKDSNGEAVIGAAVLVPKSSLGTSTDIDGRFLLSVPEKTTVIEVSSIGYTTATVTLGAASNYDVVLREDNTFLDEVVVVGYGVQKKVNVTGSVSSVNFDSADIKSRPMFNATQALSGTMPGLQVMQGSGNPYEEDFSMLVRGTGTLNSSGPLVDMNSSRGYTKNTQIFSDWYANIKFLKHFDWNTDIYYKDYRQEEQSVNTGIGKYDFQNDSYVIAPADPSELYSYMYNKRENFVKVSSVLNYNQTIKKHDISAMVGYEMSHFQYRDFNSMKRGLQDTSVGDLNAVAEPYSSGGYGTEYASRSFFGRVNYAFAGKYLFEANLRADASSRFAPEYRWGFFPSVSAGWRISDEPWLKSAHIFDNLKVRASWGRLGNNSIGNYDWQSTYGTTKYVFGTDDITNGISITAIKNYALTWETTSVTDLGLDFGVFGNRLTGTVDFYDKVTDGILYTPSMYMVMGNASAPRQNIAAVSNRGVELELGWKDNIGDFYYSVSGNVTYNKNKVSKYKGTLQQGWEIDSEGNRVWKTNIGDVSTGGSTRVLEGHMIDEYYMMNTYKGSGTYWNEDGTPDINGGPVDGMIRTTDDMAWLNAMMDAGYSFYPQQGVGKQKIWYGEYIYADANGDGLYGNSYDAVFQNVSLTPKVNYGFQISAGWKGIDFSMSWAGAAGFSIYYYRQASNSSNTIYGYAIPQSVADDHYFFDPKNPDDPRTNINSKQPRLVNLTSCQSDATSSLHLCKGDYLKLKNFTLGYTVPEKLTTRVKIQKLRVYVSGENLFAITGFPGMDPEMRSTAGYSTMRQFAGGLNITF